MKKVLLQIGFVLCFLLTAFFASTARHFFSYDIEIFWGVLLLGAGPVLGMIALQRELRDQRSKKLLIALGIWAMIITLLFLSIL